MPEYVELSRDHPRLRHLLHHGLKRLPNGKIQIDKRDLDMPTSKPSQARAVADPLAGLLGFLEARPAPPPARLPSPPPADYDTDATVEDVDMRARVLELATRVPPSLAMTGSPIGVATAAAAAPLSLARRAATAQAGRKPPKAKKPKKSDELVSQEVYMKKRRAAIARADRRAQLGEGSFREKGPSKAQLRKEKEERAATRAAWKARDPVGFAKNEEMIRKTVGW